MKEEADLVGCPVIARLKQKAKQRLLVDGAIRDKMDTEE